MMHRRLAALALLPALAAPAWAQAPAPPAYALYAGDGRPATLDEVIHAAGQADVLFVGEQHDDPVAHALEAEVLAAVVADSKRGPAPDGGTAPSRPGRSVALSLEMFERDAQLPLDEYLKDWIREKDFLAAARPWQNYATDYRPLVEFARAHQLPVIAANAPHRYVSRVGRLGLPALVTLNGEAHTYLAPQPLPTPQRGYIQRFEAFAVGAPAADPAAHHVATSAVKPMFEAQWLRDATMGYSIARHLRARPGTLVVHVCGAFHSEGRQGTPEAMQAYRPGTKFIVLTVQRSANFPAFAREMANRGDFIAVTAEGPR